MFNEEIICILTLTLACRIDLEQWIQRGSVTLVGVVRRPEEIALELSGPWFSQV